MKRRKFSEHEILPILSQHDAGVSIKDLCREHGISEATFYNWKNKYGNQDATDARRLKELEEENARLKKMYAELSLDHAILKDIIARKQ